MCLLILGIIFPRAVLLLLFFFTNFLSRAYHGLLIPVLGFLFLPLSAPSLLVLATAPLPILGLIFLVVDDKSFTDLATGEWGAQESCDGGLGAYLAGGLFVVIVIFLLAGVIHVAILSFLSRGDLAGLFVKRLVVLLVVELGFALDQILHTHLRGGWGARMT